MKDQDVARILERLRRSADEVADRVANSYPDLAVRDYVRDAVRSGDSDRTSAIERLWPGHLWEGVTLRSVGYQSVTQRAPHLTYRPQPLDRVDALVSLAADFVLRESIGLSSLTASLIDDWCDGGVTVCSEEAGWNLYQYRRWRPLLLSESDIRDAYQRVLGVASERSSAQTARRDVGERWVALIDAVTTFVTESRRDDGSHVDHSLFLVPVAQAARSLWMVLQHAMSDCDRWLVLELRALTEIELQLFDDVLPAGTCAGDLDRPEIIERFAQARLGRTISVDEAVLAATRTGELINLLPDVAYGGPVDDIVPVAWELGFLTARSLGHRASVSGETSRQRPLAVVRGPSSEMVAADA